MFSDSRQCWKETNENKNSMLILASCILPCCRAGIEKKAQTELCSLSWEDIYQSLNISRWLELMGYNVREKTVSHKSSWDLGWVLGLIYSIKQMLLWNWLNKPYSQALEGSNWYRCKITDCMRKQVQHSLKYCNKIQYVKR